MPAYNIDKLGGSTDGKGILITGVYPSTSTTFHTLKGYGRNHWDVMYIWANNQDTSDRKLYVYGLGATEIFIIPSQTGLYPVYLNFPQHGQSAFQDSSTWVTLSAASDVTNKITLHGSYIKVRP